MVKAYFSAVVKGKIDSEACLNIINIFVCQVYASLNGLFKNLQGFTFGESVGFRTSCFFLCFLFFFENVFGGLPPALNTEMGVSP